MRKEGAFGKYVARIERFLAIPFFALFGIGKGAGLMPRSEMCCVICAMPD